MLFMESDSPPPVSWRWSSKEFKADVAVLVFKRESAGCYGGVRGEAQRLSSGDVRCWLVWWLQRLVWRYTGALLDLAMVCCS